MCFNQRTAFGMKEIVIKQIKRLFYKTCNMLFITVFFSNSSIERNTINICICTYIYLSYTEILKGVLWSFIAAIKSRASRMLIKFSAAEPHLQPSIGFTSLNSLKRIQYIFRLWENLFHCKLSSLENEIYFIFLCFPPSLSSLFSPNCNETYVRRYHDETHYFVCKSKKLIENLDVRSFKA